MTKRSKIYYALLMGDFKLPILCMKVICQLFKVKIIIIFYISFKSETKINSTQKLKFDFNF